MTIFLAAAKLCLMCWDKEKWLHRSHNMIEPSTSDSASGLNSHKLMFYSAIRVTHRFVTGKKPLHLFFFSSIQLWHELYKPFKLINRNGMCFSLIAAFLKLCALHKLWFIQGWTRSLKKSMGVFSIPSVGFGSDPPRFSPSPTVYVAEGSSSVAIMYKHPRLWG